MQEAERASREYDSGNTRKVVTIFHELAIPRLLVRTKTVFARCTSRSCAPMTPPPLESS